MRTTPNSTHKNILVSIKNLKHWALMRVTVLLLCIANLSLAIGQIVFNWVSNSFYIEYVVVIFMTYWVFQFRNAIVFYFKIRSDVNKIKSSGYEHALNKEEHLAYIKEREGKGLFASIQRQLVVNTYHYNIDHLTHDITDFSIPVTILKLPQTNIVVGLEQDEKIELNDIEMEILNRIHQGLADKKIARELKYTPSTVRSYNSRIFKKLGVSTRKEAVIKASQMGLIDDSIEISS